MLKKSLIIASLIATNAFAGQHSHDAKNHELNYELAGVMRNHIHAKNSFMIGYSAQHSVMSGLYNQTTAQAEAIGYHAIPKDMSMQMHMLDLMYGVTDKLNIGIMPQYMTMYMGHIHHDGSFGSHSVDGLGDTKLNASYEIFSSNSQSVIGSVGVSLPTGSISKQSGGSQASYMMQTGSGSYELLPSATFVQKFNEIDFGIQANASIKLNDNAHNYRFGNVYNLTAWAGKNFTKNLGSHLRLDYANTGKVQGADSNLDASMSAINNPALQFREITSAFIGGNFYTNNGVKFLLEAGIPLHQYVGTGTLQNSYSVNFSVRKAFN